MLEYLDFTDISEESFGFHVIVRKRWYVVDKLVDIDERRTILPRRADG